MYNIYDPSNLLKMYCLALKSRNQQQQRPIGHAKPYTDVQKMSLNYHHFLSCLLYRLLELELSSRYIYFFLVLFYFLHIVTP